MAQVLGMTRGAACFLEKSPESRVAIDHLYALAKAGRVSVRRFLP